MTAPAPRARTAIRPRGGPLVMLALLLGGWCAGRLATWEDPFTAPAAALAGTPAPAGIAPRSLASPLLLAGFSLPEVAYDPLAADLPPQRTGRGLAAGPWEERPVRPRRLVAYRPVPDLGLPAMPGLPPRHYHAPALAAASEADAHPPYLAAPAPEPAPPTGRPDRWSLDAWAFWRQGSDAAPISQGRVPIYGASQAGAILQYRLAPASALDPRTYLRAYRALVLQGESELALGGSLRPFAGLPVRAAAEARYTETVLRSSVRPAAYAFTELPPLRLSPRTQAEAYAQAGWVGGPGSTWFADGQASVTRELPEAARLTGDRLRLAFGAGLWGGAQEDAQRLDIGPTLRLDMRLGQVPARVSVDWRQRVAGDAAPSSGVAATIATQF